MKKKDSFSKNTIVLLANYSFLLRISLIHFILVSLPFMPSFQLSLLILLELFYMGTNVTKYIKEKHIKSLVLLIPKVFQSFFLLFLEFLFLLNFMKLDNR